MLKKLSSVFSTKKALNKEIWELRYWLGDGPRFAPGGHFYSPIPSLDEVRKDEEKIFARARHIPGVDLNEDVQLRMLDEFAAYYGEIPFEAQKKEGLRYFFENPAYSYSDGIFLYSMLRKIKPARMIEIGSGYSSCLTLDVNDIFFDGKMECTFIEPYPELLESLLSEKDRRTRIIKGRLQDVPLSVFESLQASDVLFVDSTHVSKINSDVNMVFFEILPALKNGVYVHFHDILYPFEYPKQWIYEGRAWNENYVLRAFLQFNHSFKIVAFNSFLAYFFPEILAQKLPLCMKNTGGSIWLKKEAP